MGMGACVCVCMCVRVCEQIAVCVDVDVFVMREYCWEVLIMLGVPGCLALLTSSAFSSRSVTALLEGVISNTPLLALPAHTPLCVYLSSSFTPSSMSMHVFCVLLYVSGYLV